MLIVVSLWRLRKNLLVILLFTTRNSPHIRMENTEIIVVEGQPIDTPEKFNALVAHLTGLAESASKVLEPNKEVQKGLQETRVKLEKIGLFLRADFTKKGKEVIEKERELIAIIKPEEERLKKLAEEAKEKKLKEERKAVIPQRISRLNILGITDIGEEQLITLDDSQFETFFNKCVGDKNEKDRLALEEGQRKLREDSERAERERTEAIERERLAVFERREVQLEQLGFGRDTARGMYFFDGEIAVTREQLDQLNEESWKAVVEGLIPRVENSKKENEAKREHLRIQREEEARLKGIEQERERVENEKREAERIERERLEREQADREKRESELQYQGFLSEHGYSDTTKDEFKLVELSEGIVVLYKRVAVYTPL